MKNSKKPMSLLLVLTLVLSLFAGSTGTAWADPEQTLYSVTFDSFTGSAEIQTAHDGNKAAEGETVTITCTPPEGHRLESVLFGHKDEEKGKNIYNDTIGGSKKVSLNGNTGEFVMPAHDVVLWINYVPISAERHTVLVYYNEAYPEGTLTLSSNGQMADSFYEGEYVQLIENPNSGYGPHYGITLADFDILRGGSSFRMPATDITIPVTFEPTCNVSFAPNIPGRGIVTGSAVRADGNYENATNTAVVLPKGTVIAAATPNPGYTFVNWTKDGSVISTNPYVFTTVKDSCTIQANFRDNNKVLVRVSASEPLAGAVTLTGTAVMPGGYEYDSGENATASISLNSGFSLYEWAKDGNTTGEHSNTYTFNVGNTDTDIMAQINGAWEGSGEEDNPYKIDSPLRLRYLAERVNSGTSFGGVYFQITEPIYMLGTDDDDNPIAGREFTPIGNADHPFEGILDGGRIDNIYIKAEGNNLYAGLFGHVGEHAVIRNIKLSGVFEAVASGDVCYAGALAGYCKGRMDCCEFRGDVYITSGAVNCYASGNIGLLEDPYAYFILSHSNDYSNGPASNLSVKSTGTGSLYAGGAAGAVSGGAVIENYLYSGGDILITASSPSAKCYAGGIAGKNSGTIFDCCFYRGSLLVRNNGGECFAGGITGENTSAALITAGAIGLHHAIQSSPVLVEGAGNVNAGGIAGVNRGNIFYMINLGAVAAENCTNAILGGVAGINASGGVLDYDYSLGKVSGLYVSSLAGGGVAGKNESTAHIRRCFSNEEFRNRTNGLMGGIAGKNAGNIEKSYNMGTIRGSGKNAGLAAENSGSIQNCYTIGNIAGNGLAFDNTGSIQNCYSYGEVSGYAGAGGSGNIQKCYYLSGSAILGAGSSGMVSLSEEGFKNPSSFTNWDISNEICNNISDVTPPSITWQIATGGFLNRPMLTDFRKIGDRGDFKYHSSVGQGFSTDDTTGNYNWTAKMCGDDQILVSDEGETFGNYTVSLFDLDKALFGANGPAEARVDGHITGKSGISHFFAAALSDYAFSGCPNLTVLEIVSTIYHIDESVLTGCPSLSEIKVNPGNPVFYSPNGVLMTRDNEEFFTWPAAKKQTSYTLPAATKTIHDGAFDSASVLQNLTVPAGVSSIGTAVFYDAVSMQSINVASGNQYYRDIDGVLFTKDMKTLLAYPANKAGASYTIPSGVTTIADGAFDSNRNLVTLNIPSSVTTIGGLVFRNGKVLSDINVASGNRNYRSVNGVLYSADGTTLIAYPPGRAGEYVVPSGVNTIDKAAFYNCTQLTSVVLPSTVSQMQILYQAFKGCGLLKNVTIHESTPPVVFNGHSFENCAAGLTFKVPEGSVDTYRSAYVFENFNVVSLGQYTEPKVNITNGAITAVGAVTYAGITSYSALGGTKFTIRADAAPEGKIFAGWEAFPASVFFASLSDMETTFLMPETDVTVSAIYADKIVLPRSGSHSYKDLASPLRFLGGYLDIKTVGGSVNMEAAADEHYTLLGLTVQEADTGREVPLTKSGSGIFSFKFPKVNVTIKAVFKPDIAAILAPFSDLKKDAWYAEPVAFAISHSIMRGTEEGFEPDAQASRAQIAQILYNLDSSTVVTDTTSAGSTGVLESPASAGNFSAQVQAKVASAANTEKDEKTAVNTDSKAANTARFKDVKAGDWFAESVLWLVTNGIARGEGESFGVDSDITREQLAVMLYQYAKFKGFNVTPRADLDVFVDGAKTSSWAENALSWAAGAGIISGTEKDGEILLDPQGKATRAQISTIITRFIKHTIFGVY
ncbi:MAG: leucine-rich repeat protein [Clostridia bacterium]|nr:leucine-rich repeat protein [Clostridia bacterium]